MVPEHATKEVATVYLSVYDLDVSCELHALNQVLRPMGSGAFHCGIEAYGREWSFQFGRHDRTGILCVRPRCATGYRYSESAELGRTEMSLQEVELLLSDMGRDWKASSYRIEDRNCLHFCEAFSRRLGVPGALPPWVMHLSETYTTISATKEYMVGQVREVMCM